MVRVILLASALGALGCEGSKVAKQAPTTALPPGPVPVTLTSIDSTRLRTLTSVKEFVVLDARGEVRWGKPRGGPTPWAGEAAERRRGTSSFIEYDLDSYATLSRDSSATVVILADASTPARITLRDGIQGYGYQPVALAAGAANTAVPYQFGGEPWPDRKKRADLTVRADQLELSGEKPHTVLLQFTDATTTGELLTALTAIAETGAEKVRLHRMMGWGPIGPSDIIWVHGSTADDDEITVGEPAKVSVGEARVDGNVEARAVVTALIGAAPRFRYCYEKRGAIVVPGTLELSFDITADGTIANVDAKGLDRAVDACVAGAMFDLRIPVGGGEGPARARVPITFARDPGDAAAPEVEGKARTKGFWCWVHQDASVGMCAPEQAQCMATLRGFNLGAQQLGDVPSTNECIAQKTAWQPRAGNTRPFPTKAMCKAVLATGDTCREIR